MPWPYAGSFLGDGDEYILPVEIGVLSGGILEGEHGGPEYTSRILALLSIIEQHVAHVRHVQSQERIFAAYSIHFVQLMLTCTAHPHQRLRRGTTLLGHVCRPAQVERLRRGLGRFHAVVSARKCYHESLTALIKGCTLPPSSETWAGRLSEEREVYEEYRLHALDSYTRWLALGQ